MRGIPFSAFFDLLRLRRQVERLLRAWTRAGGEEGAGAFSPPLDMLETPGEILILVDLPGVEPESLRLLAAGEGLTLEGRIPPPEEARPLHRERHTGTFRLALPLPWAVNPRRAAARLDSGVLEIRLPKIPDRRGSPTPIPVQGPKSEDD